MTPELAAKLVDIDRPNLPLHEKMDAINNVMQINGHVLLPFAPVDIRFAEFVVFLNTQCSQRERDVVVISENLQRVWTTLHISVQTLREKLSPQDEKDINLLVPALRRLNLEHLLVKGLNKKTMTLYKTVCKTIE